MKHILLFLAVVLLTGCSKDSEVMAQTMTQKLYITIDGKTLSVELVDNVATQTLVAALQEGDITYEAHDYGGFEKVGALGRSLPTNDTQTTTSSSTAATRSCSSMDQTHGVTPVWGVWNIRRRRN